MVAAHFLRRSPTTAARPSSTSPVPPSTRRRRTPRKRRRGHRLGVATLPRPRRPAPANGPGPPRSWAPPTSRVASAATAPTPGRSRRGPERWPWAEERLLIDKLAEREWCTGLNINQGQRRGRTRPYDNLADMERAIAAALALDETDWSWTSPCAACASFTRRSSTTRARRRSPSPRLGA